MPAYQRFSSVRSGVPQEREKLFDTTQRRRTRIMQRLALEMTAGGQCQSGDKGIKDKSTATESAVAAKTDTTARRVTEPREPNQAPPASAIIQAFSKAPKIRNPYTPRKDRVAHAS